MSLFLDTKYVGLLSNQLKRFHRKSDHLWQMRCPMCLDSQKNERKARGYIYKRREELFYRCHNCGFGTTFANFLKFVSQPLYNEYVMEKYSSGELSGRKSIDDKTLRQAITPRKIERLQLQLPNLSELPDSNVAVKYMAGRKIPSEYMQLFYYAEDFQKWAVQFTNGTFKEKYQTDSKDPRIIIPFLDRENKLFALQARALLPTNLRYITIKIDKEATKIFGMERWNPLEKTYIVEGPIDSLFLPNCIAMAGSSVNVDSMFHRPDNVVYVYDNEKRNFEIVRLMLNAANKGYGVCVWNEMIKEKDINDMILSGRTKEEIKKIIDECTKTGLAAALAIANWRRC